MNFSYSVISNIGFLRKNNEDFAEVFKYPEGILAIVCDGLGGTSAGEFASRKTAELINQAFKKNSSEKDYLERIKSAIEFANRNIFHLAKTEFKYFGMSSTVEVVFLNDSFIYWGHIGDSRIYYFHSGRLKLLTKDHSFVQQLVDEGNIAPKDILTHPKKNVIINAIGNSLNPKIDLSKTRLDEEGRCKILICTDGVSSVVDDIEIENILAHNQLGQAAEKLVNKVETAGAPDNFSLIILQRN
ncbi:MAG TPA: protein phosphatase 2C domain-containing protein [Ignavibacteriaceae bacterium]|nr:protein phosphatase 2C domain-containing protein [Ignavibacteriaceae bacterium]